MGEYSMLARVAQAQADADAPAGRRSKLAAKLARREAAIRANTRVSADGRRFCRKHDKVWYRTPADAYAALIECARGGRHDPGLAWYRCGFSRGYHVGHSGAWKSLQRLLEAAGSGSDN